MILYFDRIFTLDKFFPARGLTGKHDNATFTFIVKKTMKKLIFACFSVLLISCEPEEETLLKLIVTNTLDQEIELRMFKTPSSGMTTSISHLIALNQSYQETIYDDGGADAYPDDLHRHFLERRLYPNTI